MQEKEKDKKEKKKTKQGEVAEITKKAEEAEEKEFNAPGIEGTKEDKPREEKDKGYITGEDVIKKLRAKGHRI